MGWRCKLAFPQPASRNTHSTPLTDTMFTAGALVFVMSIARVTVVRLKETPKYLLGMGEDAKLIETLHYIADKHGRPCSLTLEKLDACGVVRGAHSDKNRFSLAESLVHFRGLFATRQMAVSTVLIWLSWTLIGLAYPLFYVFLESAPHPSLHPEAWRRPGGGRLEIRTDIQPAALISRAAAQTSASPRTTPGGTTRWSTSRGSSGPCLPAGCATSPCWAAATRWSSARC